MYVQHVYIHVHTHKCIYNTPKTTASIAVSVIYNLQRKELILFETIKINISCHTKSLPPPKL